MKGLDIAGGHHKTIQMALAGLQARSICIAWKGENMKTLQIEW